MIDGIQLTFNTPDPKSHLLGLPWDVLVNESTGQRVDEVRSTHLRGLDLKLKPSNNGGHNLLVNGSLHKFYNCGEHNTDQFTFSKLLQSIDSFTDLLGIDPSKLFLHGLEIGVNLRLPYSPLKVFKNLVCYRSRPFTQINKRSVRKGLQCALTQYRVKVYDKAKQSGIDCGNILRFEVSIDKMQVVAKYGIANLADLQNPQKVHALLNVLVEAANGIVWTDTTANLNMLSPRESKQWLYYSNPNTWLRLGKYQRNRATKTWAALLNNYGSPIDLLPFILNTWEKLFVNVSEAQPPQPFYLYNTKGEADNTATILPLVCTVKKSQSDHAKLTFLNTTLSMEENTHAAEEIVFKKKNHRRLCLTCNKVINSSRKNIVFCSEKLYGKAAKRCRNYQSNKRRDKKRIILKASQKNIYISITFIDINGNVITKTFHPKELVITKEWLDRIRTIKALTNRLIKKK